MKKFGTPIGAAPGSANEKDGFFALGVPLLEFFFLLGFLPFDVVLLLVVVVVVVVFVPPWPLLPPLECWPCELPGCLCGWPVWCGGVWVWLLVVVVDEVELDEVEVEVEDDEEEDDDEPLPVVVVVGDVQDSDEETTPAGRMTPAGRLRLESGVPGATPGNVSTCPVISFTVTVHVSACATGIKARA